jgi:hypothetical protein
MCVAMPNAFYIGTGNIYNETLSVCKHCRCIASWKVGEGLDGMCPSEMPPAHPATTPMEQTQKDLVWHIWLAFLERITSTHTAKALFITAHWKELYITGLRIAATTKGAARVLQHLRMSALRLRMNIGVWCIDHLPPADRDVEHIVIMNILARGGLAPLPRSVDANVCFKQLVRCTQTKQFHVFLGRKENNPIVTHNLLKWGSDGLAVLVTQGLAGPWRLASPAAIILRSEYFMDSIPMTMCADSDEMDKLLAEIA